VFPKAMKMHHMPFPDPVWATDLPDEKALFEFRQVRNKIRRALISFIKDFPVKS